MNPYYSHNNQLVPVLPCPSPIQRVPYSAIPPNLTPIQSAPYLVTPPNPTAYPLGIASTPNPSSASMAQQSAMASPPAPPSPRAALSNSNEGLEMFRVEMQKMMHDNFGIEPKPGNRLYRKPHPDYFDWVPCPQGYKVPDFTKFSGVDNKLT